VPTGTRPTCPLDGVRLDLHARCWGCQSPAGPGHPAGPLQIGLCLRCRRELAGWTAARPWYARPEHDGPADAGLIDTREAAWLLGLSPDTIRAYARSGRLRAEPIESASGDERGRRLRFRRGDVARLVARRSPTPPNSPQPDNTRA
jgi:hypothetical protein